MMPHDPSPGGNFTHADVLSVRHSPSHRQNNMYCEWGDCVISASASCPRKELYSGDCQGFSNRTNVTLRKSLKPQGVQRLIRQVWKEGKKRVRVGQWCRKKEKKKVQNVYGCVLR